MENPVPKEEILHRVALSLTAGIGIYAFRQLISYCGSALEVFKSPRKKLLKIPGIGEKMADLVQAKEAFPLAERICDQAARQQVQILSYLDRDYPTRLKTLPDPPSLLFYKGTTNLNATKTVAIVGTRRSTAYGKKMTEDLVAQLSKYPDLLIVSGLAYGIDVIAHKAAIRMGIPTIGVMGTGIDIIYPASHEATAQQMLENGGLLTEYLFGVPADAPHFPSRNRIVAGMADVTIVVEAAIKGGALITAQIANDYNRDVMAVPGNLEQPYSAGCNYLIRNHQAHIYTRIEDLEQLMNWDETLAKPTPQPDTSWAELSVPEQTVLRVLKDRQQLQMDELSWQSQVPINQLASLLLTLELQGLVKALPGKKFSIV